MAKLPLVYVETNWLVACVVPHDEHHRSAKRLLEQATAGECELRLPRAAALESKHAAGNAWNRPVKAFEEVRRAMSKAYRNGALTVAHVELQEEQVAEYMARSFLKIDEDRKAILARPAVTVLDNPTAEMQQMDVLSQDVKLRGANVIDFYILSALIADRNAADHAARPAVFFSTDKAQCEREGHLFVDQRIVWRPDFQLVKALDDWRQNFDTSG